MTVATLKIFLEQFPDDAEVCHELDGKFDEIFKVEMQDIIIRNALGQEFNIEAVVLR